MQTIPRDEFDGLSWDALAAAVASRPKLPFAGFSTHFAGPHQWWNSETSFNLLSRKYILAANWLREVCSHVEIK